jgi:fucose 4-O-acetylase-like acetyltransferase
MEKPRLYFIDNLRILLITLVMMIHLSISYGGEGSWYYKEGRADTFSAILLTWHNATVQAFSMGLLFLISGYFTPGSYERKGPGRFFKDRLLRLGIPILCYDFVIGPLIVRPLVIYGNRESFDSYPDFLAGYYSSFHIGTGPLWFVEALLIFAGCYALRRLLTKTSSPIVPTESKVPGNPAVVLFALAVSIITFIIRIWLPLGWNFEPLNFQFPFFTQYICMFIVGIVAYKRNWLARIPVTMGKLWLAVAIIFIFILFPVLFVSGGAMSGDISAFVGGFNWQCFALVVWEQFTGIATIIALLFLARTYFNRQGKVSKAMSASAYTAYIIHAPIIILVAIAIRNINLYPLIKFALAVLIAVPLCFALGNVIRKLPLARRIL